MDSTSEALASLQLDDGAKTSSNESNEDRHKHKKNPEHGDDEIELYGPETSVFMEDGLFVRIASFSQRTELLRLCTLTRSDIQRKCELVLRNGGIKKDPRRDEPVNGESWVQVLRGRIALDKDLVFTVGDPLIMEHRITKLELEKQGGMFPKSVYYSTPVGPISQYMTWSGVICGRAEQAMRKGVHRAIFTTTNGYSRIGILGAFALRGKLTKRKYQLGTTKHVREYDTYKRSAGYKRSEGHFETGLDVSLAAAHDESSIVQVGLEIDIERRIIRVYRSTNFKTIKAQYVGSVMIERYDPSPHGYFWAVYCFKHARGECSVERVPADKSFESYYRPTSSVDANIVFTRQPTAGRFRNSSTRRHFDPYSSPPPSP